MAKKKKRGRSGSPESAGAVESEAPARAPEAAGGETASLPGPRQGDRFDPFGSPRARMLSNVFIALFLAYMLGMPLRYYLGGRGLDERFSWRMFSSVRMLKCKVEVDEHLNSGGERSVSLTKEVQVAWIGLLERGRPLVVEKLLTRRCAQEGVVLVDYHLTCMAPDGADGPGLDHHMKCSDGKLAAGRGAL
jgi:hypothetical protein